MAVTDGISITTSTLATFKSTPGPNLATFINEVPSTPTSSNNFYYMGHQISDSQKQHDDFDRNCRNLIDQLINNLKSRFPDGGISSFSILDPQNLLAPFDLITYGNQEIDTLSQHYGERKETVDGVESSLYSVV